MKVYRSKSVVVVLERSYKPADPQLTMTWYGGFAFLGRNRYAEMRSPP